MGAGVGVGVGVGVSVGGWGTRFCPLLLSPAPSHLPVTCLRVTCHLPSSNVQRFISRKTVDKVLKELRGELSRPTSRASSSAGSFTGGGSFTAGARSAGGSFTTARSG